MLLVASRPCPVRSEGCLACSFCKVSSKYKVKLIIKEWKDWVKRQLEENMQTGFKQTEIWLKERT